MQIKLLFQLHLTVLELDATTRLRLRSKNWLKHSLLQNVALTSIFVIFETLDRKNQEKRIHELRFRSKTQDKINIINISRILACLNIVICHSEVTINYEINSKTSFRTMIIGSKSVIFLCQWNNCFQMRSRIFSSK